MARSLLPCLALLAAVFVGCAAGQSLAPTSQLYVESLQTGGLPYRTGNGFYTPQGSSYVVDYYGQCGGSGGYCLPSSGVCADAKYPGAACPVGFQCTRYSPAYWQCLPSDPSYKNAPAGSYPLLPYEQCGGTVPPNTSFVGDGTGQFLNTSCPDGYVCGVKTANYSQCIPNPADIPTTQSVLLNFANQLSNFIADNTGAVALAPGLIEYNFGLPALDANHPAKPASVVLNISKIVEVGSQLLNKTAPGPASSPPPPLPSPPPPLVNPPPPVIPSPPPPPPGPVTNFTVPNIAFKPRAPLSISGTNLVDANGNTVNLHGFNWFGFEVGQTMVDGLYQNFLNPRNFSQVGDFATIVYRQQLLGFNTVRLPFRFADLNIAPPNNFTRSCSADSQAQIIGNLSNPTVPYYQINYGGLTAPAQTAPILGGQDVATTGLCNAYLPNDTTLNRFLWVIQFYVGNGFYVAIDFHGQGSSTVDQTIVSTPAVFQQNWIALATAIKSLPTYDTYLKGRIFLDLLNEPDAFNFAWSQANPVDRANPTTSPSVEPWGTLFTDTAAQILATAPDFLFFAEGTGQRNQPGTAFGMGFGINPAIYTNQDGLYNALGGLQTLAANAAVKARTILTPHIYGFQVTGWNIGNTNTGGLGLPYTYYNNFAYLTNPAAGLPLAGGGTTLFPVVIGEFGNVFNSSYNATLNATSDPLTDQWIHDFAEFNNNLDPVNATAYPHQNIRSSIWWDWNANSFPQLGLVNADPGTIPPVDPNYNGPLQPGWLTIQWVKVNNMTDVLNNNPYFTQADAIASGGGFGLRPWYLPPNTHDNV